MSTALVLAPPPAAAPPLQVLVVQLAAQRFAIDIQRVRELRGPQALRSVPGQGQTLLGLLELRGEVVPVHALARLLQADASDLTGPMVIVELEGEVCALAVDGLHDVCSLPAASWRPVPGAGSHTPLRQLAVLDGELLPLVDVDALRLSAFH